MSLRVVLRSPFGEQVVRDVVAGKWAEPAGRSAGTLIGEASWALPGLVDAHAHLSMRSIHLDPVGFEDAAKSATEALEAGVTLLLDKGGKNPTTLEVIERVPDEQRPEIEAAGALIATPGGYYPGLAAEIDGGDMAREVRNDLQRSAGWVKLIGDWPRSGHGPMPNFTEDEMRVAVEVAGEAGSRVAIHTMARDVPSMAVQAGVHSVEHGLFLTQDDLAVLGRRGGMWVPTVMRVEDVIIQIGERSSGGRLLSEGLANVRRLLPMAVEAGVHVLTGTDLVGSPADVAAEALRLKDFGLSERQVVEAIGRAGFEATGRAAEFEVGAPADAILLDDDPIANLETIRKPNAVIRRGSLI